MSNATTSKSARNRLQKGQYPSIAKPLPWLTKSRVAAVRLPYRRARNTAPSSPRTAISACGLSGTAGIADRHAGAHVLLDAVLREGVAQPVLRQGFHPRNGLRQVVRRQRHQHLLVE